MKRSCFGLIGFCALVMGAFPQQAQALPFESNCAAMQTYFNALQWSNPTRFSGFENDEVRFVTSLDPQYHFADCRRGYITETSPMGTRVCQGTIVRRSNYRNPNSWQTANCRWQ